ncbi:nucleotide-diphospho-sugar transferase [Calycina marina]|uniref:Nucleotide-diphospho-sugar transferase n=1 Tax=Calycina marina TaxID=1763456 RepID=A0A9P7Z8G7_9HELO|nr:nucleotide-diphospho-sugar transferase [Calycina marina]
MATPLEQWRRQKKLEYEEEEEEEDEATVIPSYLVDSPFLPPGNEGDDFTRAKPPSGPVFDIRSILRRRWKRQVLPLLLVTTVLYFVLRSVRVRWFSGPRCLGNPPMVPNDMYLRDKAIDWSKYAYVTYVTNTDYLCSALMLFESLHRYESHAYRVIMYPSSINLTAISTDSTLLQKARNDFGVVLIAVDVQKKTKQYSSDVWSDSYTKLLAFDLIQYDRVLVLDTDAILQTHLDALFFLPPAVVAAPSAYWLAQPKLGSHIMLLTPSLSEARRARAAIIAAPVGVYDMEIVNSLYGSTCSVLPYRHYSLLTGEFRSHAHPAYLKPYPQSKRPMIAPGVELAPGYVAYGEENIEAWDPQLYFEKAKYIHFSDSPYPKPWVQVGMNFENFGPECVGIMDLEGNEDAGKDCRARNIWLRLYSDFKDRRLEICGLGLNRY